MASILVAEDEESIRRLIEITLSDAGHVIYEAADGEEALEVLERENPDLLVLDVMMPQLDGWEVLREMKRRDLRQGIRVVMLTAKAGERDYLTGWKMGVDAYATKPFDPDDLVTTINETLMMSAAQLKEKRVRELEKANLLSRIESAFGEGL